MPGPDITTLINSFELTFGIIKLQTDGISHEDSLHQPPFRGNCLNWVLGHIIEGRNTVLSILGEKKIWDQHMVDRYKRGSEPVTNDEGAMCLDTLLSDLSKTQVTIIDTLVNLEPEKLEENYPFGKRESTIGEVIAFLHWHETYHTGQLELLRQLSGKNDSII